MVARFIFDTTRLTRYTILEQQRSHKLEEALAVPFGPTTYKHATTCATLLHLYNWYWQAQKLCAGRCYSVTSRHLNEKEFTRRGGKCGANCFVICDVVLRTHMIRYKFKKYILIQIKHALAMPNTADWDRISWESMLFYRVVSMYFVESMYLSFKTIKSTLLDRLKNRKNMKKLCFESLFLSKKSLFIIFMCLWFCSFQI